jgi:chaperone modulatory protein CbpM
MSERRVTRIDVEMVLWRTGAPGEEPVPVEEIAAEAGVPPAIARELLELGLARPQARGAAEPRWPRSAAVDVARAVRMARDLGLNAQGAVLALELLARIEELEARVARSGPGAGPEAPPD